ncbi:MAG: hypothetical protein Q8L24_01065 [bacterium]|nr:hypothetical protein [bacterium]
MQNRDASDIIIAVGIVIIGVCLTIAFSFWAGVAAMTFSFISFFLLDSIDDNLAALVQKQAEAEKKLAETYAAKGEKVDLKA